jgi:hypothetical protein
VKTIKSKETDCLICNVLYFVMFCFLCKTGFSQKTLINIENSPHALMQNVELDEVTIAGGFWKARQKVNQNPSLEILMDRATNDEYGYSINNFKIAAGLKEGKHKGVAWQDACLYKWIEAASYEYASTGDQSLLEKMDQVISVIAALGVYGLGAALMGEIRPVIGWPILLGLSLIVSNNWAYLNKEGTGARKAFVWFYPVFLC